MTQVADRTTSQDSNAPARRLGDERSGRLPVVLVMIVALLACGLTGGWASDWKDHHAGPRRALAERGALSGMNSYSLALMLGGLRGPLVMVLWSKVENQKIDRDLEDVDTMIEWIRLLQPEFDTVHIFQIWNKAYNISALMASSASKYTTILDAIDYARRVDADRPGDLNILDQIGRVFGEKIGGPNVAERFFYRKQFREDTLTEANRKKAFPEDDATYHRLGIKFFGGKNGPLLDENNNIVASLMVPTAPNPTGAALGKEWNDGSELQYLKTYQPFPYGIPALAMGYNYAKRAQVVMTTTGQKPLQLSETVLDSYPALLLKQWAEQEQDRAVVYETSAFGHPIEAENLPAGAMMSPPGAPVIDARALEAEVYGYGLSARLAIASIQEYERHNANTAYVNAYMNYTSHLMDVRALGALSEADYSFARAFLPGADRATLLAQAADGYRRSLSHYERIVLTYNVEAAIVPILFHQRVELDKLTDQATDQYYNQLLTEVAKIPVANREYEDQRAEYGGAIGRSVIRLRQLAGYGQRSILQTH